jgi:peptide/nickel transport system substrate-binding protein
MDEQTLREMVAQVKAGRLTRRHFVQALGAVGLGGPVAGGLLTSGGVAAAQPRESEFTPTRRGGGGTLRILMWDAPTLLHPHFGRGLRDFTVQRIFYEPLAAPAADGTFVPVLAEEMPSRKAGTVAKDGQWVTWKLKRNVVWHDGAPFTADDVIFNWEFAIDPATAASTRSGYESIARIERIDAYTVKLVFKKPQPFWEDAFSGGLLPRHLFERVKGAGAREAIGMVAAVGTGPYRVAEWRPGDFLRAEINQQYHVPNRPFFDRLEIKCGGDAVGAARAVLQTGEYDFAYYVLVEEEVLRRIEQGGKGRVLTIPSGGVSFIQCNQTDPQREVDGERSSLKAPHPLLTEQPVRTALSLLVDRVAIHENLMGRTGQVTANFLNVPDRFRSRNSTWEFSVEKANEVLEQAGYVRGADGVRAKDGRRMRLLFQAAANATVQKIQMVVKQAAARAGVEMEVKAIPASVFFSSDVNNVDTNVRFLADLQTYTVFAQLDPQFFMAQFLSWEVPTKENGWTGRNISRWRNAEYDRLWRKAEVEMDPVKRAELFIKMNDMVVQKAVVIPVTWRNVLHAAGNGLNGIELNSWDSIFGRIAYWYRTG